MIFPEHFPFCDASREFYYEDAWVTEVDLPKNITCWPFLYFGHEVLCHFKNILAKTLCSHTPPLPLLLQGLVLFSSVKEDKIEIVLVWLISVPNVRKTLFQSPNDATRLFSSGLRFSTSLVMTRSGSTSSCNRRQHNSRSIRVLIVYMTSRTVHKNVFYLLNSFTSLCWCFSRILQPQSLQFVCQATRD
jgi:hypothetical protein